jgi:ribonuclease HI
MEVYTDGGCSGNPGLGGWAYVIVSDGKALTEKWGAEKNTTNNRMELLAAINALEALQNPATRRVWDGNPPDRPIRLITDSQYVQKGMKIWIHGWKAKGWKTAGKTQVKNRDLWQRLDILAAAFTIEWIWVKGHAGNPWNERCDALTQKAIASL